MFYSNPKPPPAQHPFPHPDGGSRFKAFMVHTGPLPTHKSNAAYIGWDDRDNPYILYQNIHPDQQSNAWYALGWELSDKAGGAMLGPVVRRLSGQYKDLIKKWALSPMTTSDPGKFANEADVDAAFGAAWGKDWGSYKTATQLGMMGEGRSARVKKALADAYSATQIVREAREEIKTGLLRSLVDAMLKASPVKKSGNDGI